ncbi:Serine/threonine-protein kinase BUD32 [Xylariomycetidae sp. FL0641]|nr:Serine/threonine-protein kinase BUD32 [Xylariomycetidae sp. FL0641]
MTTTVDGAPTASPTPTPPSQPQPQPHHEARPEYPFPLPTILTYPSTHAPELITQGAEGRLYRTCYLTPSLPCALKHRPAKPWRHPTLDARLTRHRILSEARVLARCRRLGLGVPAVYALDEAAGWLALEWVPGAPVRRPLNAWLRARRDDARARGGSGEEDVTGAGAGDAELVGLLARIGRAVGALHAVGVVHGDLTTSNMMLRPAGHGDEKKLGGPLDGDIVLIDFGLASQSTAEEDRAVDLYVLERAFASTHPRAEALFARTLEDSYRGAFKGAAGVLRKLEEVRLRGRKRSMLG